MIEINDAVSLENLSHVYDTPLLQQLTMRLYAQIFSYLIKFMTWYTDRSRTRLLKSFNETALRLFEDDLALIKQISNLLSRQIQLHMSADVRVSKIMLEEVSGDMQHLLRISEVDERQARIRDAANAELVRDIVRCQIEKSNDEFKESMLRAMSSYHELMRSTISGGRMTDLLEQQASASVRAGCLLSPAYVDDGKRDLETGMDRTSKLSKDSRLTIDKDSASDSTSPRRRSGVTDDRT